jgi:SAM-dependent methyltransferase
MDWPWEIAEREHDIQNPTSPEKITLVGRYLRLDERSELLDIACGKAGPALVLASRFGCRIRGVELRDGFVSEARARIAAAGLQHLVEVQSGDARTFRFEREEFDVALCLGAAFIWGHIGDAAAALLPSVRRGGHLAVGEPYWRQLPLPSGVADDGYVSLAETVDRFERAGVALTGVVAASEDDWDRYESLHWSALEDWLTEHQDAHEIRARHHHFRGEYLRDRRRLLGWAIFVGRKQ